MSIVYGYLTRDIPLTAIKLIKKFEGLKLKSYLCPSGKWTIGYGSTKKVKPNQSITEEVANDLLLTDVLYSASCVIRNTRVALTDNEFSALLDFVYNLGGGAYQRSTLRMKLNRGEYEDAADEFLKWTRSRGRILRGLTIRRQYERKLFLT